ncbi:hypothetical protein [Nocardia sp. NPDC051463]
MKVEVSTVVSDEEFAMTAARLLNEISAGEQRHTIAAADDADDWAGTLGS